ncbi:MAG: hypothetical protein KC516_03175 [Nanoarchaeota archaeon]|nr:hypothetical protein [Nanoarchaeota archaeon]
MAFTIERTIGMSIPGKPRKRDWEYFEARVDLSKEFDFVENSDRWGISNSKSCLYTGPKIKLMKEILGWESLRGSSKPLEEESPDKVGAVFGSTYQRYKNKIRAALS